MRNYILLILFISAGLLVSCEEKRSDTKFYYPVDSVLNKQIENLTVLHATLSKHATIDGKEETSSFTPKDTTAWLHELEVFTGLNDINKPINVGKYRTEQGLKDAASNLLIYHIESTETLPVSQVKIYYLDTLTNIRKIEGYFQEESILFKTSRELLLEFQNINNKIVLTSYSMKGSQKMLLGDSVSFSVHGMITLP